MTARRIVHFVVAVWGERYVETFLKLALPSFLAPGNLPACAGLADVRFRIYTRPEDMASITGSNAFKALARHVTPDVIPFLTPEAFSGHNRYGTMALCHHEEIAATLHHNAIISVLSPDCLVADGSLSRGLQRVLDGAKAVLVAGPRGILDEIAPQIALDLTDEAPSLAIPPRRLVMLGMRHLHPISQILYWGGPTLSNFPSALYWRVGTQSMLMKYFHLHPLFVDLAGAPMEVTRCGSVDGALISMAKIPPQAIRYITHSDEVALLELSSLAHDPMGSFPVPCPSPSLHMLRWARRYSDPIHRKQFLDYDICFQGDEDIDWPAARRRARRELCWVRTGLFLLQVGARAKSVLLPIVKFPLQLLRRIMPRIFAKDRLKRLAIELLPPIALRALRRLRHGRPVNGTPRPALRATGADQLSPTEFDALVARMDRGDYGFDQATRERLIRLWRLDNGAVPYPTQLTAAYASGDALAMNSLALMEVTYQLPYSLSYEESQGASYENLVRYAKNHGVSLARASIVDVGCGYGGLLAVIHDMEPEARLHGIECAHSALAWIGANRGYIATSYANLAEPADRMATVSGQPFDVVFCTAVLEHLLDPDLGLANLLTLAGTGTVVVAVPNGRPDTAAQHINFWSPESWRTFIARVAQSHDIHIGRSESLDSPGGFENVAIIRCRN
jgi:2-polyprenyl-3-methyl-5-hydroxy-6-metoxy-1,4-benzoquinol methylase